MVRASLVVLVALAACSDEQGGVHITAADPPYAPLVGGTTIVLSGSGFADQPRVLIGGAEAPLAAPIGDTALSVVVPPGAQPGDAEVTVLAGGSYATATGILHYSTPPALASAAPGELLYTAPATQITVTGSGFLDEGAGDVAVVVGGTAATDVTIASDTTLTFTAPPGVPLTEPDLEVYDVRGRAVLRRALRYRPSMNPGLLLFTTAGSPFAVFYDPSDGTIVPIERVGVPQVRYTAVVRDDRGDYWGFDRGRRFGRIDFTTQALDPAAIQTQQWFPAVVRHGGTYFVLDRSSLHFGTFEPTTGLFTPIGPAITSCCGGAYGLADTGTTLYFTSRVGSVVTLNTVDPETGSLGAPLSLVASSGFHVEDLRFFNGVLYAVSRDGTLDTIDVASGTVTPIATPGRFNAMEIYP